MKSVLATGIVLVILALACTAGGCVASGSGGYGGADGHAGHIH